MRKNILNLTMLVVLASLISAGCSVNMAASGKMKPNLDSVKIGDSREFVHEQLGKPAVTNDTGSSKQDVFRYKSGGGRYARAFVYTILDVGTIGLWELIGTPMEEFYLNKSSVTITYDPDDTVNDIEIYNEY